MICYIEWKESSRRESIMRKITTDIERVAHCVVKHCRA